MATREQFRRFISAVIDDRLMQRPKRRSRIGGDIFNAKRFDDVEHEVRSGPIRGIYVGSRWRRTGLGSSESGARQRSNGSTGLSSLSNLQRLCARRFRNQSSGSGGSALQKSATVDFFAYSFA